MFRSATLNIDFWQFSLLIILDKRKYLMYPILKEKFMALSTILTGMIKEFQNNKNYTSLSESKAYEYLVNYLVVSKLHPEAFSDPQDIESIDVDKGSQFGIDSIAFIVNDNLVISKDDIAIYSRSKNLDVKIIFIQTKTEDKYDSGSVLKTIAAVKSFFGNRNLLREKNKSINNIIDIFDELLKFENSKFFSKSSPEVFIYYVTSANSSNKEVLINNICENEKNEMANSIKDVRNISIQLLGEDYVIDTYNEVENSVEVDINFKETLSLDKIDKVEQSYLGYLRSEEYLKIICDGQDKIRQRLFYDNVRDYQGLHNPVNEEIRQTLTNDLLKDKFILLNNGVTIVTRYFKPLGSNNYTMRDFQIVNGCQTSYEIYNQRRNIKNVLIPVKIIHTVDTDFISMIVKATNRQTPVPDEAFITLNQYHKRLQEIFSTYSDEMPIKLFYERRSGEFRFQDKSPLGYKVTTLHGLIRTVTAVFFQESYVVYNNNPVNILRNRKEKLFKQDHVLEVYYISAYLLAVFEYFNDSHLFSFQENKLKYYLIMVVNILLFKDNNISDFNSNRMEIKCKRIINSIKDKEFVKGIFSQAKNILSNAIKKNNSHESIHSLKFSKDFNQMIREEALANIRY
jgi:hypothetical protein